ncbi:MAG: hypothetical protein GX142_07455 [Chloroflexi bacterium]|jgi:poly-gamma-glutamate synthesis protein (capsule biosynthesis protein)|nr:hypothetical protein [Chloroflexota bacterium]
MRNVLLKNFQRNLVWVMIILLIGACAPEQAAEDVAPDPTPLVPTLGIPPTATFTPAPTVTPEPETLYLSDGLPEGLIKLDELIGINLSANPDASFWLGPAENAPPGEVLVTVTWVYALAAPFPTLMDNISLNELQAYWLGNPAGAVDALAQLFVPDLLARQLVGVWGAPDETRIQTFQQPPEINVLWEENAWVLLPFEALDPQLKVI